MARAGSAPRVGQHPPPTPSRIASHEVAIVCRVEYGFGGRNRRMFHDLHLVTVCPRCASQACLRAKTASPGLRIHHVLTGACQHRAVCAGKVT